MTLVAFRARNHPQQPTRDDVDDRRTPVEFFAKLNRIHRKSVDAAANSNNALLPRYWTRASNGLIQPWRGERVWCNPPFSDLRPWVEKAWAEVLHSGCELVVMLLPANRTEQRWWQELIEPCRDRSRDVYRLTTSFLPGRMRFGMPADFVWGPSRKKGDRPPFGCMLLTWRAHRRLESPDQLSLFPEVRE